MLASEYLNASLRTEKIKWSSGDDWMIAPLGLLGEIGSLAEVIKKGFRDKKKAESMRVNVQEEIGDIIWYLFSIARRLGVTDLSWPDHVDLNLDIYSAVKKVFVGANEIIKAEEGIRLSSFNTSGVVIAAFKAILEGLQTIALKNDLNLEGIAEQAIRKNDSYWGEAEPASPAFDSPPNSNFPDYERLPRKFSISFHEVIEGKKKELIISLNGVHIGDRLTDNTEKETGYRYHDVFHMSAAAFLGWSPVFRRMLKRKRKSNKAIDEVEDGARAAIIEEAVVSQLYRYGEEIDFMPSGHIDEDIIKLIMAMTTEYECKNLEGRDWKLFALKSIEIFGQVKDGFTGSIHFDADNRSYLIERSAPC